MNAPRRCCTLYLPATLLEVATLLRVANDVWRGERYIIEVGDDAVYVTELGSALPGEDEQ